MRRGGHIPFRKELKYVLKRLIFAVLSSTLCACVLVGVVMATPQSGVTSTPIGSGTLDEVNINVKTDPWSTHLRTKGQSTVAVVENKVSPGGTFGWHSHPGPSLIVVKSGAITFYHGDDPTCTGETYTAGQALVDSGNDVHVGRNEGVSDVIVIVTRIIPVGANPRTDQPDPGFCGF